MYKYKYIILCSFVGLSVCDYYLQEGETCRGRDGARGQCIDVKRCFSALDKTINHTLCLDSPKGKTVVCCSDCELVNDLNLAVISPTGEVFWKTKNKARNNCLQYLNDLPYKCREQYEGGITSELDKDGKCHEWLNWAIGATSIELEQNLTKTRAEYPHQALLGYGDTFEKAEWLAGGSIISDRFILTAAHTGGIHGGGNLTFIALGVMNFSDPSSWQIHKVKRFIKHPSYFVRHNDIALIETEKQITFTKNVLPACLDIEKPDVKEAITTTWWDLEQEGFVFANTIQTIRNMEPVSNDICNSTYYLRVRSQICFASKKNPADSCRGLSGEPLLVKTQFSHCLYTIVGVTSFGSSGCGLSEEILSPEVFTRVSFFVPWIESIVWP